MPSSHLILCHPLHLLPSIFPSIRVFSNESALHIRWPKYWSFSFNISPSNEYPGLISFRMDWFDLLAVHGTLQKCRSVFHPQTRASNTSWGESVRTPAGSLCLPRKYCPLPFHPTALLRTPTNWWVHGGCRWGWTQSGGDRPVLRGAPPGLCPSASSQEALKGDLCPGDCDEWETRKHLLPPT